MKKIIIYVFLLLSSTFLFSVDLNYFDKYVGRYEAIESESYKWFGDKGSYEIVKDDNFHPEDLIITEDIHQTKGKRFRVEYNGNYFMRITDLHARAFILETNNFLITENFIADEITFLTEDLIRIKIIWKAEDYPCGVSFYESVLYQRIEEVK